MREKHRRGENDDLDPGVSVFLFRFAKTVSEGRAHH